MNNIRAFLASSQHADTCPERTDKTACCDCGLWDARNELEGLSVSYHAYIRDESWEESSPEALAERLVRARFVKRPSLDATITIALSDDESARFDAAFAKHRADAERNAKLSELRETMRRAQADRARLVAHGLAEIDTTIARIETEIAALKAGT